MKDREKKPYKVIKSNSLNRWLVGERSYWYISRYKDEDGRMCCNYISSPLLEELCCIYREGRKQGLYNTFVKKDKQKAE